MANITGTAGDDTIGPAGSSGGVVGGAATSLADSILAGGGNDSVDGGAGDDTVFGEAGNDSLRGGIGADSLVGGAGEDRFFYASPAEYAGDSIEGTDVGPSPSTPIDRLILQGAGAYSLDANVRNIDRIGLVSTTATAADLFTVTITAAMAATADNNADGVFGDVLIFGQGNAAIPTLFGGSVVLIATQLTASQRLTFNAATANPGEGFAGPVTVIGGAGNDQIGGGTGNDSLVGNAGSDTLDGGAGNDTILGGTGSDFIRTGTGNDSVDGGEITARNTISYSNLSGTISAVFSGDNAGAVTKSAGGIDSFVNINQINGTAGADNLDGSAVTSSTFFSVVLRGSAGNDTITGNGTSRVVADYFDAGKAVNVNLGTGVVSQDGFDNQDTLINVARVTGSNGFNDTLTGGTANETFFVSSAGGNKQIDGGGGTDTYRYGPNTAVAIDLVLGTAVKTGGGTDSLTSIENAVGSGGNDTILGDDTNNSLSGDVGNDSLDGRGGFDTADYSFFTNTNQSAGIVANLMTGTATDSWGNTDTLVSIEQLTGTNFADDLTGLQITDATASGGSESNLRGLAGNDTLRAPTVDSTVDADYRQDPGGVRVNLSAAAAVLGGINIAGGTARDGYGDTDTLVNIQIVIGSNFDDIILGGDRADHLYGQAGNDTLIGGAGDDSLAGGAGADSYDGGGGFDLIIFSPRNANEAQPTTGVVASLLTGLIANDGYGNAEVIAGGAANSIEMLIGTSFNDDLTGRANTNANVFGGVGPGYVRGGLGADSLRAAVADSRNVAADYLRDADANSDGFGVTVNLASQTATDGWGGTDSLFNIGAVRGSAFADSLIGNGDNNWFRGEAGADTIVGGNGVDFISYSDSNLGVLVNLLAGTAQDGWGSTDSISGIEQASGSEVAGDTLLGDTVANAFNGYGGDDSLSGWVGNDTLLAHDGADTLDGGKGSDSMVGGVGNDLYIVDAAGDTVVESPGGGIDTVQSSVSWTLGDEVEALVLTGRARNGTGNTLDNSITGSAGRNSLDGDAGADTLDGGDGSDTLDGGLGADSMAGGLGNDVYIVDDVGDVILELAGGGVDLVRTSIPIFTIAAELEELALLAGGVNRTGNAANNVITGNTADNVLSGLGGRDELIGGTGNDTLQGDDGNDTLEGGTGRDSLEGGAGRDLFRWAQASHGRDTIASYDAALDDLGLSAAGFGAGLVAGVALTAAQFESNTTGLASTGDVRFVFNTATKVLSFDADGSGAGAASTIVTLTALTGTLGVADVVILP